LELGRRSLPKTEGHKNLQDYSAGTLKADIFEILCAIPVAVLRGICGAGLQARKVKDEELFAWLTNNLRKSAKSPCIYMLELTSSRGRPPTLGRMREFARCARAYLDPSQQADLDLIVRNDQHSADDELNSDEEDERRQQTTRTWLPTRSGTKNQDRVRNFLDKLDENIEEFARSNSDEYDFPYPLRDVGYSDDCLIRLDTQENLKGSSNRILSLFNAIAQSHTDDSIKKRRYRA
jgi:hypothetical protein